MGRLLGATTVRSAVDSDVTQRIYVLADGGALGIGELKVYDTSTLTFRGALQLPRFTLINGTQVNAEGQFVFANSAGTRVYVLQRAPASSGLNLDWAFVTLTASVFP